VPQAALAASSPAAGPLDLIDFSAASTRAGNAVDEEVMWQKAVELGVHVVRGEACAGAPLRVTSTRESAEAAGGCVSL
jgi:hypothetical protein